MIKNLLIIFLFAGIIFPVSALEVKDSTVFGRETYLITWTDNDNKPRQFALVKQSSQSHVGTGQFITYYDGNTKVVITSIYSTSGSALNAGFGSTTHHNSSSHHGGGTLTPVFIGDHHAIFEWKHTIDGAHETVTYTFMDGHDYFQWQNTVDGNAGTANGDSRGPYCTMQWDGIDFSAADGVEYGAAKYFSQPVYNGPWTFSGTCDIPFCREWDNGREVGYIQTQTFTQQLAGNPTWGGSLNLSSSGNAVDASSSTATQGDDAWAFDYQMNFYDQAKKITWGMPYGYMNAGNDVNAGSTASGTKNGWGQYSLSIIFDSQTEGGVYRVRDENRAIHNGTVSLTASVGSIVTTGPVGTANPATQTLSPSGYDHNYRTFWVEANASGISQITFNAGAATIQNPTFRMKNVGSAPSTVTMNSTTLTEGTDYYTSYNSATTEAWITIKGNITGSNTINFTATSTGIVSATGGEALKVFPNPFYNEIYFEEKIDRVEIQNLFGEKVIETTYVNQVNTENIPSGVYLITVISGERKTVHRMIKK